MAAFYGMNKDQFNYYMEKQIIKQYIFLLYNYRKNWFFVLTLTK